MPTTMAKSRSNIVPMGVLATSCPSLMSTRPVGAKEATVKLRRHGCSKSTTNEEFSRISSSFNTSEPSVALTVACS